MSQRITGKATHLSLLVLAASSITLKHGKGTIKQEISKPFNTMTLPVFDTALQFLECFLAVFQVDSFVRSL